MAYVLTFIGGAMFGGLCGIIVMSCCIISGEESRREEKYLNGEQNQGDGI